MNENEEAAFEEGYNYKGSRTANPYRPGHWRSKLACNEEQAKAWNAGWQKGFLGE